MPASKTATNKSRKPLAMSDRYYELVREFALVPVTSDEQADAATDVIHRLLPEALDAGGQAYLDVLSDLVATYEERQREESPDTPADRLRQLMELNDLTQARFAARTGIKQATVSDVLNGKRLFTAEQMLSLGRCFVLHPGYFLGTAKR